MAATKNLRRAMVPEEVLHLNMAPMIDLVFLLLIFFMVASTLIKNRKDPDVNPPVAPDAVRSGIATGQVVINILEDGTMRDEFSNEVTEKQITAIVKSVHETNKLKGIETKVLIRADRNTKVEYTKRVVTAAGEAGVINFIFSAYKVERGE